MTDAQLVLCGALILAGLGLFQWESVAARKAALVCFWLTTGIGFWFLSGRIWVGLIGLLVWILFPVSEVVIVLRKLRLPRQRSLTDANAPVAEFPLLREVTRGVEELGFVKVDDCDLTPAVHHQFYRLFTSPTETAHAFIGYISHGGVGFHFIGFASEDTSGHIWVTWDYPLTYGLKMPPQVALFRALDCESEGDLLQAHRDFLEVNDVTPERLVRGETAADVRARLEKMLEFQVVYNIHIGILAAESPGKSTFRYSWRGAFYVAGQVLRDLVKL